MKDLEKRNHEADFHRENRNALHSSNNTKL